VEEEERGKNSKNKSKQNETFAVTIVYNAGTINKQPS